MSALGDIYKRRAADAAMTDLDRALNRTPALMANGLPNAAHVYARRRKESGFMDTRVDERVELVHVARRDQ